MSNAEFLASHTSEITLDDGKRVVVRPIGPDDRQRLREGLAKASAHSRYLRFLRPVEELSEREEGYLVNIDYRDHFAWAALAADEPGQPGLGVARYVRQEDDPDAAEAALIVIDEAQGMGIGTLLIRLLAESAQANGIKRFTGYVSAENRPVVEALTNTGAILEREDSHFKLTVELPFPDELFRGSILRETLRAIAAGQGAQPAASGSATDSPE